MQLLKENVLEQKIDLLDSILDNFNTKNVEFDKPGLIYKRLGRGAVVTATGANINELSRWVAPNGTTYWIVCATDGKVYVTTVLAPPCDC